MIIQSRPLLTLYDWFSEMGMNPLYSFQLGSASLVPIIQGCNPIVFQYSYQNAKAVGRREIEQAILTAERMLQAELGFAVGPQFECDEMDFPTFLDKTQHYGASVDVQGRWLGFQVANGWLRNIGTEKLTQVGDAYQCSLEDVDLDGVRETFKIAGIPKPAGLISTAQVLLFFDDAYRFEDSADANQWMIEPIKVVQEPDDTLTITGSIANIVKPILYQGFTPRGPFIDLTDPDNFAEWFTVYIKSVDTNQQGEFVWETRPSGCGQCPDVLAFPHFYADPSAYAVLPARYTIRNEQRGWVAGGAVNSATDYGQGWPWRMWFGLGYQPSKVRVNYLAGYPTEGRRLAPFMKTIVARLAAAELTMPICACETSQRELFRWQTDLALNDSRSYQFSQEDLNNPFGTRRGHVDAWKMIQNYIRQRGIHSG